MTNINNEIVKTHAEAALQAYKLYDVNINDIIEINGQKYKVLQATPDTTSNGFQGIILGKFVNNEQEKYDEIIVSYRGSMPPDNFNFNELIQDWFNNDFKDIVGGDTPRQFEMAEKFYAEALKKIADGGKITVTGHSLGGAIAQLICAKYKVCRLGFNPTSKSREYKKELKTAA